MEKEENYLRLNQEQYPFIPRYYGYFEIYNEKYLLIEYIEGKSLDKYELELLTLQDKYNMIFGLILTIKFLHSLGYVYRDLKLDNIIINQNKEAILIDFDRLIKVETESQTID